ncbi:hypothetical protein OG895_36445 [Streptomyces sp. NBC_00201]|uniref:hypothetical protein n=1 Tax=unclassified Streptomyces TaxID=2593676 RepID=UPI0022586E8E|nr:MULTISPECIES: hypothetical protein [unclassified Streptomyces]MCX5250631.1 hypothetical protein [Streptomyces sp. NBC_00201]MCX5291440.1 hypothetical protein [Streptomyces sp. NBC_00183]
MTHTAQEHPRQSTTRDSTTPVAPTQPMSPQVHAYAAAQGDPLAWSADTWRIFLDLGGAA